MPNSTATPKVFVSYSRADTKEVLPLVGRLEEETGVHFWIDREGIESGAPFEHVIMSAIEQAKIVLFMSSDSALKSKNTEKEIGYAQNLGKRVIPIVLHGGELKGWFLFNFGSINYIDASQDDQLQRLIVDIRRWLHVEMEQTSSGQEVEHSQTPATSAQPAERRKSGVAVSSSRPASASPSNKQARNDSSASHSKPSSTPTPPKITIRSATTQVGKQAGKPKTTKRHQNWGSLGDIMFDVKLWLKYDFWFNIKLWFEYDFEDWITSTGLKYILIAIGLLMVGGFQLAWCKPFMDNAYFGIVPIVFALCTLCIVIWGFIKEESGLNQLLGIVSTTIFGFISAMYINVYWLGREGWDGLWQESMATGFVKDEEFAGEIPIIGSFSVCESVSPHKWIIADMDVTGEKYGHDYVDLGLSVKWATMNVGASSPQQYGDYFAWGETSPKDTYTKENSQSHGSSKLTNIAGISSRDAARADWGSTWRLPTLDEMEELASRCTWTWGEVGDLPGYKVTGPNGKSMFLPAAGYREKNVLNCNFGTAGYYWTSTAYTADETSINATTYACSIGFSKNSLDSEGNYRYCGLTIRPVCE